MNQVLGLQMNKWWSLNPKKLEVQITVMPNYYPNRYQTQVHISHKLHDKTYFIFSKKEANFVWYTSFITAL